MSINKSWSAIIILFTVLLSGSYSPSAQEPTPGPPVSEEERRQMIDSLRQRLLENQQQPNQQQPNQQQRNQRGFAGGMFQQAQPPVNPAVPTPAVEPATAPQQISLTKTNGKMQLVFKDADLSAFIQQIAELLGLTPLVIDSDVKGTVTIHSSAPMTTDEVRSIFQLILKTNNASLIEQNGIYQVVPISSALKTGIDLIQRSAPDVESKTAPESQPEGPPVSRNANQPGTPNTVLESTKIPTLSTNLIRVEFIPVKDLIEPIKLFMTDGGVIMTNERLNMLILTDYEDSIDRILKVIHVLDNQYMDKDLIELIEIKHNASTDVAADLKKMFGDGTENAATGISFVSLDRLNAIFVMASSKRALTEVKNWIDILDTTTGRSVQMNEFIVQNSTASNIATLLYNLYGGEATGQAAAGNTQQSGALSGINQLAGGTNQQRGSFGTFSNTGTITGGTQGRTSGGTSNSGFSTGGQQLNPQFNASRGISSMVIQEGELSGFQDTVRLVVDDISNRLIIQSTGADYAIVLEAIQLMDVAPLQVVIDARVFEVDLTDELSFGVGAALRERTGGSVTEVGINSSIEGVPTGALTAANIALVGNSQELLTALSALREKTNVKILEAPSVLAMDGTEAHITVGSEIPYTGQLYFQNNSENPTQSVDYRDTGVTLSVLPHISASGSVTLEILQEVSGLGPNTTLGPTFTKSRVECTLTVKDGETVAIAGLIRDSQGLTRSGFPILSDIPIIGSLFGQTSRSKRRTELIIVITPHVIKDADAFKDFTRQFKDSMRNVRKFSDGTDLKHIEDLQDATEDRQKVEEKKLQEIERQKKREERSRQRTRD